MGTIPPLAVLPQITVSLWANWSGLSDTYQGMIGMRNSWSESNWQIEGNGSTGEVGWARDTSSIPAMPALPVGEWTHICMTFDGQTATMATESTI